MTVVNIIAQLPVSNNIAQLPGLAPHGRIAAHGETNKCECGSLAPPPTVSAEHDWPVSAEHHWVDDQV